MHNKPYRPTNGFEGVDFQNEWCMTCRHYHVQAGCPILNASMMYETDEPGYPNQWIYGKDGRPECVGYSKEEPGVHVPDVHQWRATRAEIAEAVRQLRCKS